VIRIDERMYSVPEVARLIRHKEGYVRRLIEAGKLAAVRPSAPCGFGQWRVHPDSLRKWLGVPTYSHKTISRHAKADMEWLEAMSPGRTDQPRCTTT